MASTPVIADLTLSAAMRVGSQAEHQEAEDSSFMSELLGGRVNEQGYADYLLRLRTVYDAMEETVRAHLDQPAVAAVHDTALERLDAIDADLDHWCPDGTRTVDSPAAQAYRERLVAAGDWSGLLVAHHYTRYLGDLSGGQAIARLVARHYGATPEQLSFYRFDIAEDGVVRYKRGYREAMNDLALAPEQVDLLIAEVRTSFRMNSAIFEALAA